MNKYISTVFILFWCFTLNSIENHQLIGIYKEKNVPISKTLEISGNRLNYLCKDYSSGDPIIKQSIDSSYIIETIDGIDFIVIEETNDRWLLLYHNEFLFLYDSEGLPFFTGERVGMDFTLEYFRTYGKSSFKSTSNLIEIFGGNRVEYTTENLTKDAAIPFPWVEGEDDNGIGVSATATFSKSSDVNRYYLFISNGYVSYLRPDLYKKNSRVKKVSIENTFTGEILEFELEDIPHFQQLDISKIVRGELDTFELTILEIYEGTKYNDTCINMIVPYDQW